MLLSHESSTVSRWFPVTVVAPLRNRLLLLATKIPPPLLVALLLITAVFSSTVHAVHIICVCGEINTAAVLVTGVFLYRTVLEHHCGMAVDGATPLACVVSLTKNTELAVIGQNMGFIGVDTCAAV